MKKFIITASLAVLTACSTSNLTEEYAGEKGNELLLQTGNYSALVKRYQEQIKSDPSSELRFKLADALYRSGDPESAEFQLNLIPFGDLKDAKLEMLRANVFFDLDKLNNAERHVNATIRLDEKHAEAYNLKGLLLAQRGDLNKAKEAFENARLLGFDEGILKNNLAMVAMLQGDFNQAADILMTLAKNGQADETVRANLLLSLAKAGRTREFSQLLSENSGVALLKQKYIGLSNVHPITQYSQASISPSTFNRLNQQTALKEFDSVLSNGDTKLPVKKRDMNVVEHKISTKAKIAAPSQASTVTTTTLDASQEPKESASTSAKPSKDSKSELTTKADPVLLARQRVQSAQAEKERKERELADKRKADLELANAKKQKREKTQKRSRYLVTDLLHKSSQGMNEYVATSDFELGKVRTQYLEKRRKWVFDIEGAKDFTVKRKQFMKDGPAKVIELGEHKDFVRIVLEMHENTPKKPEIVVSGNTLTIRWDS